MLFIIAIGLKFNLTTTLKNATHFYYLQFIADICLPFLTLSFRFTVIFWQSTCDDLVKILIQTVNKQPFTWRTKVHYSSKYIIFLCWDCLSKWSKSWSKKPKRQIVNAHILNRLTIIRRYHQFRGTYGCFNVVNLKGTFTKFKNVPVFL